MIRIRLSLISISPRLEIITLVLRTLAIPIHSELAVARPVFPLPWRALVEDFMLTTLGSGAAVGVATECVAPFCGDEEW